MDKKLYKYWSEEEFKKAKEFAQSKQTPFLLIDPKRVAKKYKSLKTNLPLAKIYYAMKANPHDEIIRTLADLGSNFDVASIFEIQNLMDLGIAGDRMSFGNPAKKESDIIFAYQHGIRIFVTDSIDDVHKLAKNAPGAKVFFRLLFEGNGAIWPLSKKFGAHPDMLYKLILEAKNLGLEPYGISFHVGSQQKDIGQWDHALSLCKYMFDTMKAEGLELKAINLGGGLPTKYTGPIPSLKKYTDVINRLLSENFGDNMPEIMIEPGRYIAGDCGMIVSEIILISKKSETSEHRWVYIDVGNFTGLCETEEVIFPIYADPEIYLPGQTSESEVILAGPTCDSSDIIYQNYKHKLPDNLKEGDRLYVMSTGAYTYAYSAVCFNGFPVLKTYILR
jgi:ornithine decarboxylase